MINNFLPWKKGVVCPLTGYKSWLKALQKASMHYVEYEGASEWSAARPEVEAACEIAISKGWPYWVQQRMWNESDIFLLSWDQYMETYIKMMHDKMTELEDEISYISYITAYED